MYKLILFVLQNLNILRFIKNDQIIQLLKCFLNVFGQLSNKNLLIYFPFKTHFKFYLALRLGMYPSFNLYIDFNVLEKLQSDCLCFQRRVRKTSVKNHRRYNRTELKYRFHHVQQHSFFKYVKQYYVIYIIIYIYNDFQLNVIKCVILLYDYFKIEATRKKNCLLKKKRLGFILLHFKIYLFKIYYFTKILFYFICIPRELQ